MRSFPYLGDKLPQIRVDLRAILEARSRRDYALADNIRDRLLSLDSGMKINQTPQKVSLWHWPDPPFTREYHFVNYGEFIANSDEA